MQGTHARVAAPREDQLFGTAGADHLVVDEIRRHAHQRQVTFFLTDDFMACRKRDQVGKAFHADRVAIVDVAAHSFLEGEKFSHYCISIIAID